MLKMLDIDFIKANKDKLLQNGVTEEQYQIALENIDTITEILNCLYHAIKDVCNVLSYEFEILAENNGYGSVNEFIESEEFKKMVRIV